MMIDVILHVFVLYDSKLNILQFIHIKQAI